MPWNAGAAVSVAYLVAGSAAFLVAGSAAFLVAGALVPLLVRYAVGRNLLDVPNLRSSHEVPTPRLGGVAMMVATWIGFGLLLVLADATSDAAGLSWPLLLAATVMWAVGLADDLSGGLGFKTKAAAQTVLAAALVAFHPPQVLSAAPGVPSKIAVFVIGVVWVVALCNAFNFMDGIDGITGGVAVIGALFLGALVGEAGTFLPALAGATLGFLVWNVSPASTFCGDSGSYFLGFSLAAVALYAPIPAGGWSPLGFVACALVFTPYLFDTAHTLVTRFRAGKDVFSAHREHIYQRITPGPGMHRRTSNLYYAAAAVSGISAMLVAEGGTAFVIPGFLAAFAVCAGLAAMPLMLSRSRELDKRGDGD